MTGDLPTLGRNLRWEWLRLRRSRRVYLLVLPLVAGPVGSALADAYLGVPSLATARVLGLFITAGLAALLAIDLSALAVGEELASGGYLLALALPQSRPNILAGRLLLIVALVLGAYAGGAAAVWEAAGLVVRPAAAAPALLDPAALAVGVVGLLLALIGVTAAAAVVARSAAQATVAGVLGGVVAAGVGTLFLLDGTLHVSFPVGLGLVGVAGLGWALYRYPRLEA